MLRLTPKFLKRTFLAALGFWVGMGLTVEIKAEETEKEAPARTCFWIGSLSGFNSIDNRHVYLDAGPKEKYLATTFSRCHDLRWTETLAIETRPGNRVCSNGNEYIRVLDRTASFPQRCLIKDIEQVENLQAAKELVEKRKQAKEEEVSALDEGTSEIR